MAHSSDRIGVIDNKAESQFELETGGATAIAAYERKGDTIVFTHTVVPEEMQGHGLGSRLIKSALDSARVGGLSVVPQCGFVAEYIDEHPEYADLVN